jgi:hypothetical protein
VSRQHQTDLMSLAENRAVHKGKRTTLTRRLWHIGEAFWGGDGLWGILAPLVAVGLLLGGVSWQLLGPIEPFTDAARYQCYAVAFWRGAVALRALTAMHHCQFLASVATVAPFHTLPLEYPLLALVPFTLGLTAPVPFYQLAFALWMGILVVAVYFLLRQFGPRGSGFLFLVYLVVGGWGTAMGRFDLVPAALALGSLIAATRARWRWSYVLLALATMLKFYPVILLPALFIAEQCDLYLNWYDMRRLFGIVLFISICAGLTLLSLALSVPGTLIPFSYFGMRPIQVESLPATILWFAHLAGIPSTYIFTFGSLNVLSPWSHIVSLLFTAALIAGLIGVLLAQLRGWLRLDEAYLVLLLVIIVTGKVFSPQYLIWLAPVVAYVAPKNWRWFLLWITVSLLTTVIYPYIYDVAPILKVPYVPAFFPVVATRDLLLLFVTVAYGGNLIGLRRTRAAASTSLKHWLAIK